MNLKHGDIITLENGDTVKVSLEVISEKITKLISNRLYKLKRQGGMFCHILPASQERDIDPKKWEYIGKTKDDRYVFKEESVPCYSLWGTDNLDFVIKEIK